MGRVVVFDLETSGFSAEDRYLQQYFFSLLSNLCSIIEIGAVELIDGERTGSVFQSYAKALGPINPYAFAAHELSEEFLSHHPSIEKVCTNFVKWYASFLFMLTQHCHPTYIYPCSIIKGRRLAACCS